jgi:hypothetical protein
MFSNFDTEGWGFGTWILVIVLSLALIFGLLCLEAWLVMLLWNAVIPLLWATAPELSFWVAMGLLLLCHFLFRGVRVSSDKK